MAGALASTTLFPPGQPGTPGTSREERRLPVAPRSRPTGQACQVHSVTALPMPRAGHGQVHGGGQQADSPPGSSAGQGAPGLGALSAPYIGPGRPRPASDGRAAAVPQGPSSFGEEVHVTLSPPCMVGAQEASVAQLQLSSGARPTWQEINRGSHTMAWTESADEQRVCRRRK